MAFVLSKLAFLLLRPSNLLLLLALAGLAAFWTGARRRAGALLGLSLGAMLLVTVLPVGDWLIAPLEDRFPRPPAHPDRIDGAVVLGGGVFSDVTAARGTPTFFDSGERYMSMLELARRYPEARIVFTGGVGRLEQAPPEVDTVAMLLEEHGLAGRVEMEGRSRNTRENALFSRDMVRPQPGQHWLLVTSAGHMPRAVGCFRGAGWPEMIPWPVDYRSTGPWEWEFNLNVSERLYALDEAAREWLGLAYYRALGWIPSLFPAP